MNAEHSGQGRDAVCGDQRRPARTRRGHGALANPDIDELVDGHGLSSCSSRANSICAGIARPNRQAPVQNGAGPVRLPCTGLRFRNVMAARGWRRGCDDPRARDAVRYYAPRNLAARGATMKCPHCLENFHDRWGVVGLGGDQDGLWRASQTTCPLARE